MQSFLAQKRLFTAVLGSEKVANPVFKAVENRLSLNLAEVPVSRDSKQPRYAESSNEAENSCELGYKCPPLNGHPNGEYFSVDFRLGICIMK